MAETFWLRDFEFEPGALRVKKTGVRVPLNAEILHESLTWLIYYLAVEAMRVARAFGKRGPRAAFVPDRPRPWYLIWPVIHAAGGAVVSDPAKADLVVQFDDSVRSSHAPPPGAPAHGLVNFGAVDISKSRVAEAFERAFGYPLAVCPRRGRGIAVEKSEANGVHDGQVICLPVEPQPGRVYQRLVNNRAPDGLVEDLRTPTVGGRPVCVFVKRRPMAHRFGNENVACPLRAPEEVFSAEEIAAIGRFCAEIGFDWGGLDILRDHDDGRLYIVDANKTDMGPPIAMPLRDKLEATRRLALAFRGFAEERRALAHGPG
jgi:hypothetical protein